MKKNKTNNKLLYKYDYNRDWYYNIDNVSNSDGIFEIFKIIDLLKLNIDTLQFVNIIYYQYEQIKLFSDTPFAYIEQLNKIPIGDKEKIILKGCIIKWGGGISATFKSKTRTILKLIYEEIKQYDTDENKGLFNFFDNHKDLELIHNAVNFLDPNKENTQTQNLSNNTPNQPPAEQTKPIKLNLSTRQIIYLFQRLIEEDLLKKSNNPNLWNSIATYFENKEGKIKNIHQSKDGLTNTKTAKPKHNSTIIKKIVSDTKNSNDNKNSL